MFGKGEQLSTGGKARIERLSAKINVLEQLLYPDFTEGMDTSGCSAPNEAYTSMLDIDSWIKFWLVNEIMDNKKLETPESCFFTFESEKYSFKAGPVWDFDLAGGSKSTSCQLNEAIYYNALFKSPEFITRTKELWNKYSGRIDIEPRIETIQNRITLAAKYDAMLWTGRHDYINIFLNKTVNVFDEYVEYLKESVNKKIPIVDSFIENLPVAETNP